ncbi:MAG: radical SAM protein [Roseibium sp.]|nr:radical SAM protein [Roseibium sp.]
MIKAHGHNFPFRFHLRDERGDTFHLLYDNHSSKLIREDTGERIVPPAEEQRNWNSAYRVSPETPGRKTNDTNVLKIQLGLGCNYTCSYCLQSSQIQDAVKTGTRDAEIFLKNIENHNWFGDDVSRIEFWGGEPMLYWHKVRILLPELKKRWPKASFSTITNGSMFNEQIIQDMEDYDFSFAVSHDGPGHKQTRGPDPLDEPERAEWLKRAVEIFGSKGKMSCNAVLTSSNYDCNAIIDWFEEHLPGVIVGFEGIGYDYHGDASTRWTVEKLEDMRNKLASGLMDGSLHRSPGLVDYMYRFAETLAFGRPSKALGQRCGMDRAEHISVDLLGNIMTCQNTGSMGKHRLGHMMSLEKATLDTSWHWSKREECSSCPVLQMCAGGCMYLDMDSDNWKASCNTEFYYRTAILTAALFHMTGGELAYIEGEMLRPELPEFIETSKGEEVFSSP